MRLKCIIIGFFLLPIAVFSQSVRLDTNGLLTGFFKLSRNDFEIDSNSAVASEKDAYIAQKAADVDADGKILYSEYMNYRNKVAPDSISKYDLTLSRILPVLKDFDFNTTGGIFGTGTLAADFTLPGNIVLTEGATFSLITDGLLVSNIERVQSVVYEVKPAAGSAVLLLFDNATEPMIYFDKIIPEELNVDQFITEITGDSQLVVQGKPIKALFLERLGGKEALQNLNQEQLLKAMVGIFDEYPISKFDGVADLQISVKMKNSILDWGKSHPESRLYSTDQRKAILKIIFPNTFYKKIPSTAGYFTLFPQAVKSATLEKVSTTGFSGLVVNAVLSEIYQWFKDNPPTPDETNFSARRNSSRVLDQLGYELSQAVWADYYYDWENHGSKRSVAIEAKYPILQYLRIAEQKVLDEVRNTKVIDGVKIWQMYNLGIIVKTPEKCFAIDFIPVTAIFTDVLDFAVVSHSDSDHIDNDFILLMLKLGKPVYAPVLEKYTWIMQTHPKLSTIKITEDTIIKQGATTLYFKLSTQGDMTASGLKSGAQIPCLITTVDCGISTKYFTILHTGDANFGNIKAKNGNPILDFSVPLSIDFMELHVGLSDKVSVISPKYSNLGHVVEFAHYEHGKYFDAYSWPFDNGFVKKESTSILTWGESLYFRK